MIETISVIIPTYNRAAFICRAVESALCQTYRNVEVIVVDDGSTDGTKQLMEKFSCLPNFRYIFQLNKGRSIARNKGIQNAAGSWIMYLDSDDYLDKYALQTLYNLASEAKDSVIVYANFLFYRNNESTYGHQNQFAGKAINRDLFVEMVEGKFWLTKPGTYIINKKIALDNGGFSSAFEPSEDMEYCIRMLLGKKASYVNNNVLYVERHAENTDETELQQAVIKICKHYLSKKNEWKQELSPGQIKRVVYGLKLRIANVSYELNRSRQSFYYYSRVIKAKPSMIFDRFIFKQLVVCLLPRRIKK
jgi:glycosyltransferase involved in cell wall biosynthesis